MEVDTSKKFSPSKLAVFEDCPRRYRYRYVDGIRRDTQSVEAFLGTCVHKALEELYEDLRHGKTPGEEEVVAVYSKAWDKGWSERIVVRDARWSPADWKKAGEDCVRAYYKEQAPFTRDKTVGLEARAGFDLETPEGTWRIEGFIDRLALAPDGAFEIHDYKTSKNLPGQKDLDEDRQLAVYELAVRASWPDAKAVRLVWHYVRHGKTLESRRTPEQLKALEAELAALIARIKAERDFPPRKSALCDWCEYRDLCPLWAHAEKLAALPEADRAKDEPARLVAEIAAIADKKRELKERLKQIEKDEAAIEARVIKLADEQEVSVFHGEQGELVVSKKDVYKLPTKTHSPEAYAALEAELRASPLWKEVSTLDSHRLVEGYKRKDWPEELWSLAEDAVGRYAKHLVEKAVRFHKRRDKEDD